MLHNFSETEWICNIPHPSSKFSSDSLQIFPLYYPQSKFCHPFIRVTPMRDKRTHGNRTCRQSHHPTSVKNRFILLPKGSCHFYNTIHHSLWMPDNGYQKVTVSMSPPGFFGTFRVWKKKQLSDRNCHTRHYSDPKLTDLRSCCN